VGKGTNFSVVYPAATTVLFECYPAAKADYAQWAAVGKPACWCYARQCYGDADNASQTVGKLTYWVYTNDLAVLSSGWAKTGASPYPTWICADFAHDSQTVGKLTYRVYTNDLTRLSASWAKTGVATDCLTKP